MVSPKTLTVSSLQQPDPGTYKRLTIGTKGLFTRLIGPSQPFTSKPQGSDLSHVVNRINSAGPAELFCSLPITRMKDDDLDAGAWDADLGEFVAVPTGAQPARNRTKTPALAMADTHVERDDFSQPDFSECEVHPWHD